MSTEQPSEKAIANFETRYFRAGFIEKHGASFVSWGRLDKALTRFRKNILDGMATAIGKVLPEFFENRTAPILARIAALEKTAEELKAGGPNLADAFKGSWMPGDYRRGHLVTMGGSLWLALADSAEKPGTGANWKMVTKRGADGRDVR